MANPIPIPILAGVYVDGNPALRVAYPVNMIPVPAQDGGIADGFLRPAEGIVAFAPGQGVDRGAIVPTATGLTSHFRVSGTKLITVSTAGAVAVIGTIAGTGLVRMVHSFDLLGVAANNVLYYWNGITLITVSDPNAGTVLDVVWVDGYWLVTDGTNVACSELTDPNTFSAIKYGGTDRPDPIQCLLKVQNELHVVSRSFIDVFQNVGGAGFPFQRVNSAVITKGAVGRRAACVFKDAVAFVGGGNSGGSSEAPSVWIGRNAQTVRISSREIDNLLLQYTTAQLATIHLEPVVDRGSEFLYLHLPDRTVVYDAIASAAAGQPVWCILVTAIDGFAQYRAINITRFNDRWVVGDPLSSSIGVWSTSVSTHWGSDVRWELSTQMIRNNGLGAVIHQLELVALTGVTAAGIEPRVSTSYSTDGKKYSQEHSIKSGNIGQTDKRLVWFQQGTWRNGRIQRFRGDSGSHLSALRLEAQVEALAY
jgi:hypothetical protein